MTGPATATTATTAAVPAGPEMPVVPVAPSAAEAVGPARPVLWQDATPGVQVDRLRVEPTDRGVWVLLYSEGEWVRLWVAPAALRRILALHLTSGGWQLGPAS